MRSSFLSYSILLVVVSAFRLNAEMFFSDRSEVKSNYWDHIEGWKDEHGAPANRFPLVTDHVGVNNSDLTPETPLTIDHDFDATCRTIQIASATDLQDFVPTVRIASGSLLAWNTTITNDLFGGIYIARKQGTHGLFLGDGGTVTCAHLTVGEHGTGVWSNRHTIVHNQGRFVVGEVGYGNLTVEGGKILSKRDILIGVQKDAVGELNLRGGSFIPDWGILIGQLGTGKMFLSDPAVVYSPDRPGSVILGGNPGSKGSLVYTGGELNLWQFIVGKEGAGSLIISNTMERAMPSIVLGMGSSGSGSLELAPDATLRFKENNGLRIGGIGKGFCDQYGLMEVPFLRIGGSSNSVSTLVLHQGATNRVIVTCQVGGYELPDNLESPGYGEIRFRGGVMQITSSKANDGKGDFRNLKVGRFEDSYGVISGWGELLPNAPGVTNVRIEFGNGKICADGEGEMRDLDFTEVVNVSNSIPNTATGTNGWYAVNQGRVLYPRGWMGVNAEVTRCFGDLPKNPYPGLVNAVQFTMKNLTKSNNYLRGGIYANDRADIPAGLPEEKKIVGVWRFGLFADIKYLTEAPFSSAKPSFRFDHTRRGTGTTLTLLHHNGIGWQRVKSHVDEERQLLLSDEEFSPLTEATYNIGFFAIVSHKKGSLILLK